MNQTHLHLPHPHRPTRHDVFLSLVTMLVGVALSGIVACATARPAPASPTTAELESSTRATMQAYQTEYAQNHPGQPTPALLTDTATGNMLLLPSGTPVPVHFFPATKLLPKADDWTDTGITSLQYVDVETGVRCYRSNSVSAPSCVRYP